MPISTRATERAAVRISTLNSVYLGELPKISETVASLNDGYVPYFFQMKINSHLFNLLLNYSFSILFLWWEPKKYYFNTYIIPVILQKILDRVFVTGVDITQDILWISNLVEHHLHIGENVIDNTEGGGLL